MTNDVEILVILQGIVLREVSGVEQEPAFHINGSVMLTMIAQIN